MVSVALFWAITDRRQLEEFVNRLLTWLTVAHQQVSNLSTLPIFQNIPSDLTNVTAGLTVGVASPLENRVTQTLQLASRRAIFGASEFERIGDTTG